MAAHGKVGDALERYHNRKLKSHKVSGVYVADGAKKPVAMTQDEFSVTLRKRGSGKGGGGQLIHFRPYTCEGRHRAFVKKVADPLKAALDGAVGA